MKKLFADETGQDLAEYALLLAAIIVASAAVIVAMGGSVATIWTIINSRLGSANQAP